MDLFDDASVPSSPKTTKDDQMEPGVLLEESWFFGNLLDRKSRMLRCYSDPCPSSKNTQDLLAGRSMEETFSSLQKLPEGKKLNLESRRSNQGLQRASKSNNLQRTPSLPVYVDHREDEIHDEESDFSMGKLIRQASINHVKVLPPKNTSKVLLPKAPQSNLQRAPSLPAFVDKEEIHDEENDFSMGKLIRQASLNHARVLPPKYTSKGLTKCSSISSTTKHHSRRKQEQESNISTGVKVEDLQGFKKLDINYEKKDSIPKLANKIPGLKEKNYKKKQIGLSELEKIKRPYVSEAWLAPAPDLVVKKSSEDMKEHIKFWARAVASNVR